MNERQLLLFEDVPTPAPSEPPSPVLPHPWPDPPGGAETTPGRHSTSVRSKEYPLRPSHRLALEKVFDSYRLKLSGYTLRTTYYRYTGLSHTIRIRDRNILVRVSHYFEDQPDRVIEAVGHILVRKLLRMRPLRKEVEICRMAEQELEPCLASSSSGKTPSRRGTRHVLPGEGKVHNLVDMRKRLARRFFPDRDLDIPVFWSSKRVRGYWGKYFQTPPRIVINRRLDSPRVPGYVVEAVVYHEMLHHILGIPVVNGRRRPHFAQFREAERRYPLYQEAEAFLKRFS